MRVFVYAQSSGFTPSIERTQKLSWKKINATKKKLFIMSTASWEVNCGINDCFLSSKAVNFETEVIEFNFEVSNSDWIWVAFSSVVFFFNLGELKLGKPELGEPKKLKN